MTGDAKTGGGDQSEPFLLNELHTERFIGNAEFPDGWEDIEGALRNRKGKVHVTKSPAHKVTALPVEGNRIVDGQREDGTAAGLDAAGDGHHQKAVSFNHLRHDGFICQCVPDADTGHGVGL